MPWRSLLWVRTEGHSRHAGGIYMVHGHPELSPWYPRRAHCRPWMARSNAFTWLPLRTIQRRSTNMGSSLRPGVLAMVCLATGRSEMALFTAQARRGVTP